MAFSRTFLVVSLLLGLTASAVAAQPGEPQGGVDSSGSADGAQASPLDVSRLPVDLNRIERQLRASAIREERDGLNLRYVIDVYGRAPRIRLFTREDNLRTGQPPYGAPTHSDILNLITPQEFRSPVMDFNALFRWLSERGSRDRPAR